MESSRVPTDGGLIDAELAGNDLLVDVTRVQGGNTLSPFKRSRQAVATFARCPSVIPSASLRACITSLAYLGTYAAHVMRSNDFCHQAFLPPARINLS
jgi:hypothetical protein